MGAIGGGGGGTTGVGAGEKPLAVVGPLIATFVAGITGFGAGGNGGGTGTGGFGGTVGVGPPIVGAGGVGLGIGEKPLAVGALIFTSGGVTGLGVEGSGQGLFGLRVSLALGVGVETGAAGLSDGLGGKGDLLNAGGDDGGV